MRTYIRAKEPGAAYFFTVNLVDRQSDLLIRYIGDLRTAFRKTRADNPFEIDAIVVLPEHLHCIWKLPESDGNFSTRWRLIKARFSRTIPRDENVSASRERRGERGIWQRRLWEHLIRDEDDYLRHLDYIHYNPVKHGLVTRAGDWPHSSFRKWVRAGAYESDWGPQPEAFGWLAE